MVDEIQRLGSLVKYFNETIDNLSQVLIIVSDQDYVVGLYNLDLMNL